MIFENREDAGRQLALKLKKYKDKKSLVIALPRGGVPVAKQISGFLNAPLDVLVVRKIGSPENKEFAIGAIASGGTWFLDKLTIQKLGITREQLDELSKIEVTEMIRRDAKYRHGMEPIDMHGKTVILVDDGIATGATTIAAIRAIAKHKPKKLIAAVPICSRNVFKELSCLVDEFVVLDTPSNFSSVGNYYKTFSQLSDEDVVKILRSN